MAYGSTRRRPKSLPAEALGQPIRDPETIGVGDAIFTLLAPHVVLRAWRSGFDFYHTSIETWSHTFTSAPRTHQGWRQLVDDLRYTEHGKRQWWRVLQEGN